MIQDTSASNIDTHSFVDDDDGGDDEDKSSNNIEDISEAHLSQDKEASNSEISNIELEGNDNFDTKSNSSSYKVYKKRRRHKEQLANRFTSRMVRETNEYIVIKLTKEEVIAEMKGNLTSQRYSMAPYKCEKCAKGFNFDDVLQSHMEKHSQKNGPFQCEMCSQYCPSAVSLRGHIKSHTTRYKCRICKIVRNSRQHILEHHSLEHTDGTTDYKCTHCTFTSKKRTVMQRHVRVHVNSVTHPCHRCGKLFRSRETLRVHTSRHDDASRYKCSQCARNFVYNSSLHRHVQRVHERNEFYCVECDVTFTSMI
ncbi:zinc finger protein 528-like [Leptidea sinapis]|uniref:zinc finger protein 528-like n=1 Tax=Leptidea sinapis TaxID=189913 RepID=UPI0021C426D8|nr:zinc finger protein 528-like [Leptidea sinapis]